MNNNKIIEIFTDGSARGNPGPGGYGVLLRFNGKEKILSEGFRKTTNNRMELLAVITALETLKTDEYPVTIYSDSKYVIDAITKGWIFNWLRTNFKNKKNKDLWIRYLNLHSRFKIDFVWVKGHAGHPENERCDKLAVSAAEQKTLKVDSFYESIEKL